MNHPITIAVSSCLLGQSVRYDGTHKQQDYVTTKICTTFHCIPICPEIGIGLGVPRTPIQLVNIGGGIHARQVTADKTDVTEALLQYADSVSVTYPLICGCIFKSRSPSCGVNSTPVTDVAENMIGKSSGIYSGRWQALFPDMPVLEESALNEEKSVTQFIKRVNIYAASRLTS